MSLLHCQLAAGGLQQGLQGLAAGGRCVVLLGSSASINNIVNSALPDMSCLTRRDRSICCVGTLAAASADMNRPRCFLQSTLQHNGPSQPILKGTRSLHIYCALQHGCCTVWSFSMFLHSSTCCDSTASGTSCKQHEGFCVFQAPMCFKHPCRTMTKSARLRGTRSLHVVCVFFCLCKAPLLRSLVRQHVV